MKDPLTKGELNAFEQRFLVTFRDSYQRALASGAFDKFDAAPGSHRIARIALCCAATGFAPNDRESLEAAANYEHF